MARLAAWIGLLLVALYVILVGGAAVGVYAAELRVVTMACSAGVLVGWALVAWRRPTWRPRSRLWPAIVAALASLAISTVTSRYPRVSVEYLAYAVVLATFYLLLVRLLADPFFRRRIEALSAALFVMLTGLYVGLIVWLWVDWWDLVGHLAIPPLRPGFAGLTYRNPSAVLTMVTLLAVPTLARFAGPGRRRPLVVGAILGAVAVVAILSGSRAGWFALGATGGLTALAWLAAADRRTAITRVVRSVAASGRSRGLALAAIALVGVGTILLAPPLLQRITAGGEASRLTFSVVALRIFAEAPLLGTGPGTWVIQRAAYTRPGEPDEYIPYAHNLETQTLAELGLVGAIAGLVLLASLGWLLRDGWRDPSPDRRRWAVVAAIGLLYFALHQLLDFYGNMPATLIVAAIPIAYLDATARSVPTVARRAIGWPRGLGLGLGLASAVAIAGLTAVELPAVDASRAVGLANEGDWAAADAPARSAASLDPSLTVYDFTAGLTAAHAGDHAAAAERFARVAATDDLPEAWLNLAAERDLLGDTAGLDAVLRKALRLGIQRPAVAFAAGDLALRLGQVDLAADALASAVAGVPSLAADPWWGADPDRSALRPRVLQAARARASPDATWELELMLGDAASARSAASGTSDPALATAVTDAWLGDAGARATLLARCDRSPLDAGAIYWCARVLGHDGDRVGQDRYRTIAALTPEGSFDAGVEIRVATTPLVGRSLAGSPSVFWAPYTYRRVAPWDILVPSLVHLAQR